MNIFELIFKPIVDFVNALFGLAQTFISALQGLVNSLFEVISRLFGG